MGGLLDILNKVVNVEMKPHEGFWIEYVGELRFAYEGKQYYIGDYVKYLCKRDDNGTSKMAVESGDLIVISTFDVLAIRVNPKSLMPDKTKKKTNKKKET
jgi:hypothetical protein